jgi:hypothetical protein
VELNRETFIEMTGMPDYGPMLSDMFEAFGVHGCKSFPSEYLRSAHISLDYGGKEVTSENLLARKPRSWSEFLDATPVQDLLT